MRPDWGIGSALLLFALAVLACVRTKKAPQLAPAIFLLGCGSTLAALTASARGAGWMLSMVSFLLILGYVLTQKTAFGGYRESCSERGVAEENGEHRFKG